MSDFYSTALLSPRQTASIQHLQTYVSDKPERPDPHQRYVCVIGKDAAHNCDIKGADMVLVGHTTRDKLIYCFASRVGYCLRCFNAEA